MRFLVATLLLAFGCSKPRSAPATAPAVPPSATASPSAPSSPSSPSPPSAADAPRDAPPPLEASPEDTWKLDEDTEIRVTIPAGIRTKRPIVLGVHGAHDRAEWACPKWNATFAGFAFVVCPKGQPWWPHQAWGPPEVLADRADRGVAALRARHGAYVADGPVLYAGFSQGGTLASQVVALRPGVYDTVVLVEVGHTPLNAVWAVSNLKKGGATRAIVSCATYPCLYFAKNMSLAAKQKDFPFEISEAGVGRGHFFDDLTYKTLGPALAAALREDPRWAGFSETVAAKWPDGG